MAQYYERMVCKHCEEISSPHIITDRVITGHEAGYSVFSVLDV